MSGIVRQLQQAMMSRLKVELSRFEFAYRPKGQHFVRDGNETTWLVHVSFVRHKSHIEVSIDLAIRFMQVASLLARADWKIENSAIIGAELGNLVDGRPRRWTVRSEEDASDVAKAIMAEMKKFSFEWFREFSDLSAVYEVLAPNDRRSWLVMPLHLKRYALLLAIAHLLERDDELPAIVEDGRAFLLLHTEKTGMDAYNALVSRLAELK